jgi:hypothetical protein
MNSTSERKVNSDEYIRFCVPRHKTGGWDLQFVSPSVNIFPIEICFASASDSTLSTIRLSGVFHFAGIRSYMAVVVWCAVY